MNILSLGHFDAAGVNTRYAKAYNKYGHGSWRTYFLRNEMELSEDINPSIQWSELKKIVDETDIFIVNPILNDGANDTNITNDWDTLYSMNDDNRFYFFQYILESKKPIVFYINGSNNARKWSFYYNKIFEQLGVHLACSTPDLTEYFPKAKYTPSLIDLEEEFWNLPKYPRGKSFKIGHFPTNPAIKNTKEYLKLSKVMEKDLPIKFNLTMGLPYIQSINLRRDLDFTFDHLQGYYGINSLESAILGCVNFVKLQDSYVEMIKEYTGVNDLPWTLVNDMEDVSKSIEKYITKPELLDAEHIRVMEWMRNHWSARIMLDKVDVYFSSLNSNNEEFIKK